MDCFMTILVSTLTSLRNLHQTFVQSVWSWIWNLWLSMKGSSLCSGKLILSMNSSFFQSSYKHSTCDEAIKVYILKHPHNAAMKSQWHSCTLLSRLSLLMFVMITEPKSRMVSDLVARKQIFVCWNSVLQSYLKPHYCCPVKIPIFFFHFSTVVGASPTLFNKIETNVFPFECDDNC